MQRIIRELALREYAIPGSRRCLVGEKTIESWYYAFRRDGIDGLMPKTRNDRGVSKLPIAVQEAVLAQLQHLLERAGTVARGTLSRSAIHRLLRQHGLSRVAAPVPEEHRRYGAEQANAIWYGDVMHGPTVTVNGRRRKVYLVSLMDDASRLIAHSAFCLGETALDIESVLKQAVLKRGLPRKLVVDNGAAYRAATLQGICARLDIPLIYCRPYAPEGKGKLERWHRTFRDHFLSELDVSRLTDLDDLNARVWAWIEQVYHRRPHGGLDGQTPLERYQQDLPKIRLLGLKAARLDELFQHRVARKVRKDGTVSYQGRDFEVEKPSNWWSIRRQMWSSASRMSRVSHSAGRPRSTATPMSTAGDGALLPRRPPAVRTRRSPAGPPSMRSSWPISSTTANRTGRVADHVSSTLRPQSRTLG